MHRNDLSLSPPGFEMSAGVPLPLNGARDEESLRNVIQIVRKRKFFILAVIGVAVGLALLVCTFMPPQYTSTATLLVDKDNASGLDLGSLSGLASAIGGTDDVKTDLQTHASVLQNDSTILEVVQDLHLDKAPPYKSTGGWFGVNRRIRAEQGLPIEQAPATREHILKIFSKHLKVEPVQDTRLITVAYRDSDADRAAAVSNALVEVYIQKYLRTRYKATADASKWLGAQLDDLKAKVEASQSKLSDYERKTGLSTLMLGLSLGSDSQSSAGQGGGFSSSGGVHIPAVEKLDALNAELTAAESDRIAKEAIYRLTQSESPDVVVGLGQSDLTSVGTESSVTQNDGLALLQDLRQQESSLRISYADAASKFGARNPHLTEIQAQLDALSGDIHSEMDRIRARAKNDLRIAQDNENGIRLEYARQQEAVNALNDSTIQLEILATEALSSRALYEGLYSKLQEANVEAGVKATNLIVADPARPAYTPTRPNWILYPAIALGAGFLFGVGGAFVRENLDDKLTTSEQIEHLSTYPVLAAIPAFRAEDLRAPQLKSATSISNPEMLISSPTAPISESFRTLRTAIQLSNTNSPLQTLLITSPTGSEGKSTISCHLAVAFAQHYKRVLIIDGDMRKPRLHSIFGVTRSPGLTEVLSGNRNLEEAIQRLPAIPSLSVIAAGIAAPNPAELLSSKRFDDMIERLRPNYDLIIIDSPPALLVTDPILLTRKVDGTIVVIRASQTTRPALIRLSKYLDMTDGRKLGFILNDIDTHSSEYYYSYGYYGKDKYYEQEAN